MIPFMASFKINKFNSIERRSSCGLGVAKAVVALQIFIHQNNHIFFLMEASFWEFLTKVMTVCLFHFLKSGSANCKS